MPGSNLECRTQHRKPIPEELRVSRPPDVQWEFADDHPDQPMLGAARYDVTAHELIINADWRGYLQLRNWAVAEVDQATTPAERVWSIVAEEWSSVLSHIVMNRRFAAFEDGLLDRIGDYLSEDALTTAMTHGAVMRSHVSRTVQMRTRVGRRRLAEAHARLAAAE